MPLIQVNLGNNETWDTHGEAFSRFKNKLFPPTDRALCALLDDLEDSGLLESTMIVMAGEFGRTPKLSTLEKVFYKPGRDHWGAVQTAFFAGGGVQGGTVVGSSDSIAGYPASSPMKPENMAATMYHALGIPHTAAWKDELERPQHNNHGDPDHQNRTRPRARYVLALCAATLSSVRATKKYDGKQAEIAENWANFDHRSKT